MFNEVLEKIKTTSTPSPSSKIPRMYEYANMEMPPGAVARRVAPTNKVSLVRLYLMCVAHYDWFGKSRGLRNVIFFY